MEWIKRFSHTIDYIEQNLDNEISVADFMSCHQTALMSCL